MARIKVVLFRSKKYKDGTFPVMIRVTHKSRLKYIPMKISVPEEHWDEEQRALKTNTKSRSSVYKRKNLEISKSHIRLLEIVTELDASRKAYSVDDIEKKYNSASDGIFNTFVNALIDDFKLQGKYGNAKAYKDASQAFLKFLKNKEIRFDQIDFHLLKKYETALYSRGARANSISFYMRTLRAIYNRAIKEGLAKRQNYPFTDYKIPSEKTQKRALSKDEIIKIRDLDLSGNPAQERARDFFMFSFYCMGMSFIDIAYLKVANINNNRLNYSRQKTAQTYNMALVPPALQIIKKFSDLSDPSSFVFPILNPDHKDIYSLYQSKMQVHNLNLKKVGKAADLSIPLTSYVARHSWATIAKRSGIPTAVISEGLGHTTEKTTQIYLDSFENDVLDQANRIVTL